MAKLKLGPLIDEKPVKVTVELPASLHRNLTTYANLLAQETGGVAAEAARLIVPMLERFVATDRAFSKRKQSLNAGLRSRQNNQIESDDGGRR